MKARTILIVEEDRSQAESLGEILEIRGYETLSAHSCAEGLRLACEARPPVAILDTKLPDGSGTELLGEIKKAVPDCTCITMTADTDAETADLALNRGADHFLRRPVNPSELFVLLKLTFETIELRKKSREFAAEAERHRDALERAVRERTEELEAVNRQLKKELEDRRSVETSLRESEAKYRLFAENAADVIWTSGLGLSLNYISPSINELTGYTPEETIALKLEEFYAPESIPIAIEAFAEEMETEKSGGGDPHRTQKLELLLNCRDGSVVCVETIVSFIRDESGVAVGIQGVTRDITERKEIEGALTNSEANFRSLIEQSPDPVIVHRSGRTIYANSAALEFLGRTWESLEALPAIEFVHPDYRQAVIDRQTTLRSARFTPAEELGYLRGDGTLIFGEVRSMQTIFDGKPAIIVNVRDLTERKEAEANLRSSEENFRLLIQQCPDPIIVHDGKRFLYSNEAVLRVLGYEQSEISDMPIRELLHPDDLGVFAERQDILDRSDRPPIEEIRCRRKDGSFAVAEVHAYTTTFDGRPARIVIARDVTERKEAEEALRGSEEQYRTLIREMPDPITIHHEGRILFMNQAVLDLLGYEWDEAKTISVMDFIHPEDHGIIARRQAAFERGELPSAEEIRYLKRDGGIVVGEAHGYPTTFEGQEARIVVARDVTARKEAEEAAQQLRDELERRVEERTGALRESEEQFRHLLNATAEAIYGLDLDGRCTFCNRASIEMLGYESESDLLGNNMHDLAHYRRADGSHYPNIECRIYKAFRKGEGTHVDDEVFWRADGTSFPAEYWSYPIRRNGKVIGSVVTFLDITERRKAETERAALEEQLRQSQKMEAVGQLAGGIAHDFNNLLTAINGYADLSLHGLETHDPLYHDLDQIRKAGDRAASLTRQLLAFSRKQILQPQAIDLGRTMADMKTMLGRLIGEHIELVVEQNSEIPKIRVDPGQLEQVILNLIINARDAMPRGGTIRVETENVVLDSGDGVNLPPGPYVRFSVVDTGCGMDEAVISHIFEPFYTTKGEGKGTGLGLSTVFGIIAQSDGAIEVESRLGEGSTFHVYLPEMRDSESVAEREEVPTAEIGGRETVLLVEDEEMIRRLLKRTLEQLGYTVLVAAQGGDALLTAERHDGRIDLLVTDVVMPQMSGIELAERLKTIRPEMQILYVSGYNEEMVADQGLVHADMSFLQKPFTKDAIGRKVREVLEIPARR